MILKIVVKDLKKIFIIGEEVSCRIVVENIGRIYVCLYYRIMRGEKFGVIRVEVCGVFFGWVYEIFIVFLEWD